jgi:hypothetical protein
MPGMATAKLTITVRDTTIRALRADARRRGASVSSVVDVALRNYLISEALRSEPSTDDDWLGAVAEAIDGSLGSHDDGGGAGRAAA